MTAQGWAAAAAAVVALLLVARNVKGGRKVSDQVVRQKIAAGAVILDVRTPEEFATGAYPRAVNIPVQALARRMGELPKDRPIVVYCASGMRSASAAAALARAGFADVVNAGGLGSMPR